MHYKASSGGKVNQEKNLQRLQAQSTWLVFDVDFFTGGSVIMDMDL